MTPGGLPPILWSNSRRDLADVVRVQAGFESARLAQAAHSQALIMARIYSGAGVTGGGRSAPSGAIQPRNSNELAMALGSVLGRA